MPYRLFCPSNFKLRIEVYPFLFLLAELSTSSNFVNAAVPNNLPVISYYANREGELTPIIAGASPRAVLNRPLVLGVNIDGQLHPIFDHNERWIMMNLQTRQIIPVTINLPRMYRHLFPVHILQRLQINNDGEYYMPRDGHPNAQHIEPRNGHPNGQHIEPRDGDPNVQHSEPRDGDPNGQHIEHRDGHPNGQQIEPRDRRPNGQDIEPRNVRRRHD